MSSVAIFEVLKLQVGKISEKLTQDRTILTTDQRLIRIDHLQSEILIFSQTLAILSQNLLANPVATGLNQFTYSCQNLFHVKMILSTKMIFFRISPEMDVIFLDFSQEITHKVKK